MHKYFNFARIFEAEQMGEPLMPEEMGTPSSGMPKESTEKLEDFGALAETHILEITLTQTDLDTLNKGEAVVKEDAKWKKKENKADYQNIKMVILNTSNEKQKNDPSALLFNLDDRLVKDITKGVSAGVGAGVLTQVLTGLAQNGTSIPDITVEFIKSTDIDTSGSVKAVPASPEQIESGSVLPGETEGTFPNESKWMLSFDQYVNESKKKSIDPIAKGMKKGPKNKLEGDKMTKGKDKLKSKSKTKEKFPDLSGDGKVTRKDILMARGVIKK
jgi:hypothetical protein